MEEHTGDVTSPGALSQGGMCCVYSLTSSPRWMLGSPIGPGLSHPLY